MNENPKNQKEMDALKRAFTAVRSMREKLEASERAKTEPIAVVGLACRFPGGANSPEAFWRVLQAGVDTISEVPPDRWDANAYFDVAPDAPGKMYTREGGFLDEVDKFDAEFFGITPREAINMDPQQRMLMEVSWEALENAGIVPDQLKQSSTGVFVGVSTYDYLHLQFKNNENHLNAYAGTGGAGCVAAGRLSFYFGLNGPSITIDTACSSSLVALDLAVQHLRSRKCSLALSGGVSTMLSPGASIIFSKLRVLSASGRCKTFDATADGYGRGEGCGIVVLKRLSDALAEGDTIRAVIRGSAVNHDGRSSGLTVPNGPSQQGVIRMALDDAGVDDSEIGYVEAHGTGTALGDPIEMRALATVLKDGHSKENPLVVGSVKTNIGHLEAAAGIASLIKVVLSMEHGEIPPHLHFNEPSPHIPWDEIPVVIPTESMPWPSRGAPRIAGVSSFGFSGTNAHVILEEAPTVESRVKEFDRPLHLLQLSGRNEPALKELAGRYASELGSTGPQSVGDVCYTANAGRSHFEERLVVVGESLSELGEQLSSFSRGEDTPGVLQGRVPSSERPKVAFLFTGQGSQSVGMGRQLYETQPTFRKVLDECDGHLREYLKKPLLSVIYPEDGAEAEGLLDQTGYTQPALFAIEYALAQLWRSWGIEPSAVMGHSVGEYVAASVAGIFSLEDGLKLIAERGRLMQSLPQGGEMAAVFADESRVFDAIASYKESVSIAAFNGPENTVISGVGGDVQAILRQLEAEGVNATPLKVSHAFHSPLMEPMLDSFEQSASEITYSEPKLRFISNTTGSAAGKGEVTNAKYWRRHVRQPVRFFSSVQGLFDQGYEVFVESGPHPVLLGMAAPCVPQGKGVWLPSLRRGRDDWKQMLESLGTLYLKGVEVDWEGFDRDYYPRRKVDLPTYAFQHKRYWIEQEKPSDSDKRIRIPNERTKLIDCLYEVDWVPVVQNESSPLDSGILQKEWLVLGDSHGVASSLIDLINKSGGHCTHVLVGEHFDQLNDGEFVIDPFRQEDFERLLRTYRGSKKDSDFGIIHLWSLKTGMDHDRMSAVSLEEDQRFLCGSILALFRALDSLELLEFAHLWVVTRGAQSAGEDRLPNITQSPIWGLIRSIMLEHPEAIKAIIDLDVAVSDEDAQLLHREIHSKDGEKQVRFIDGLRHVARLTRGKDYSGDSMTILPDETYLITGGLGVLGLRVAHWLVEKGARNLVLCGRNDPSGFAREKIDSFEQMGCRVSVRKVDVSVEKDVRGLIDNMTQSMPVLRGIIHAAGVLDDGILINMEWDRFAKVLSPKVSGAWNLHQATKDLDLRFFVFFSSAVSTIGAAGQSNYSAANAFLDALARYRKHKGLPALSVGWGPWSDGGMAAGKKGEPESRFEKRGLEMISPELGLAILEQIVGQNVQNVCVLQVNWQTFFSLFPSDIIPPFFSGFSNKHQVDRLEGSSVGASHRPLDQWRELGSGQRVKFLEDYLRGRISRIIGLEEDAVSLDHNFLELGLDSLMIMELVNHIQQDFDLSLYAREVFERPTIGHLAGHLDSELKDDGSSQLTGKVSDQPHKSVIQIDYGGGTRAFEPAKEPNPSMAFLLSSPRSGSTLLRVMLAGHSQLFCPPELHLLPFSDLEERKRLLGESYLTEGLDHAFMELRDIGAEESRALTESLMEKALTAQEVYRLLQESASPRLLVDKSPTYASSLETLEWAEELFHRPKYIHLVRHPFSVIESFTRTRMQRLIGAENEDPSFLAERVWCEFNANIIDFFEGIESSRHHRILYEDLVQDPERIMGELCSFLEIDFEEALLHPYEGNRMTTGIQDGSVGIGDPNFLGHKSIESSLADAWKKVSLGRKAGGFMRRLARELDYELPKEPTVFKDTIEVKAQPPRSPELKPVSRTENIPLSFQQERLWFLTQLEPEIAAYNLPGLTFRLQGALNRKALQKSLNKIIHRHEILRTTFHEVDAKPIQVVLPHSSITFKNVDLSNEPDGLREEKAHDVICQELRKQFNLKTGPLLRAVLIDLSVDNHILSVPIHHIVSDGWSFGVLLRELSVFYNAFCTGQHPKVPESSIQYGDFAIWQREWLKGDVLEAQLEYWKEQLGEDIPVLQLPTDHPRPAVQTYCGADKSFKLPAVLSEKLEDLSRQQGVTLFMTMLAAFETFLYRHTGQTDFSVGSPIANRKRVELEGLIGFFVNTLVLRSDLSGDPTFIDLLKRVREVTLGAYDHQELPFEKLVEELRPVRDMSYSPLFQVMFVLQNVPMESISLADLTLTSMPIDIGTSKFDLTLFLWEEKEGLGGKFEYNTNLFESETIDRMVDHFKTLLESLVSNPNLRLSELSILPEVERHQILVEWNDTAADFPEEKCIHTLFEEQAEYTPEAVAIIFGDKQLSYCELNCQANRLAHYLRKRGVGPGEMVGISVERSCEMIVGLLGILKAGGAYVPLDPDFPEARLAFMLEDTKPRLLLTKEWLLEKIAGYSGEVLCLDRDFELFQDELETNLGPIAGPEDLAHVIYTSGSTGKPKGILTNHRSAVQHLNFQVQNYNITAADTILQISSFSFDTAVRDIFGSLMAGAKIVIVSNDEAKDPAALVAKIDKKNVTCILSIVPSFLAQLVMEGSRTNSVFTSLRHISVAGESLAMRLCKRVWDVFGCSIVNQYGPTECTQISSFHQVTDLESDREIALIGRPIPNRQFYILDDYMNPVPVGVAGEAYIGGDGLAIGYLNQAELTAEKFIPNPFSKKLGARLYKTGDIVRYLRDGAMEFLGRKDFQIKLRGIRIEPGEIEATLCQHPSVNDAVVVVREDRPGDQRLVAYLVVKEDLDLKTADLRYFLNDNLPNYMVPSDFVVLDAFPLTANGKINRRALPEPNRTRGEIEEIYVAPRTHSEDLIAGIWRLVLGLERIGVYDNFFELGGHSLLATQVISRICETFQGEIPLRALFEAPTVADLAAYVDRMLGNADILRMPAIVPVSRERSLPLSFSQERLWFLQQLEPESTAYSMPGCIRFKGQLDEKALEEAFFELARRHETLRTTVRFIDGVPRQIIATEPIIFFEKVDLSRFPDSEREAEAIQLADKEFHKPFDLESGPLVRVYLCRLNEQDYMMHFNMHHIISDYWSFGIINREITELYRAFVTGTPKQLPELTVQYADFAYCQRQWLQGEVLNRYMSYWKEKLGGELPTLDMPTDRPRPAVQTHRGGEQSLTLPKRLVETLRDLRHREGVSFFMILLAAFKVLLFRYTGQEDIIVGTPIAGRDRTELEGLIGFFINTIVMRTDLAGDPTFKELLERVRETALEAYAHQDMPFGKLVEELAPKRDLSRTPLFQIFFNHIPVSENWFELPELEVEVSGGMEREAKFDMEFLIFEDNKQICVTIRYNSDLFDADTIERMIEHFKTLLESIAMNPDNHISQFDLLRDIERQRILLEWNATQVEHPKGKTLIHLFEEQVARTPSATAVICEGSSLSYRELNRRANQVAHLLHALNVQPDDTVGICIDRSLDMVVGLLGVLKSGAAYLPLDPYFPENRIEYMLEDSGSRILITESLFQKNFSGFSGEVICIDSDWQNIAKESENNPDAVSTQENLAYVIYTSGSTGKPKGVQISHRGLANFLCSMRKQPGLSSDDTLLSVTTISFDIFGLELFLPLITGAKVVIASREAAVNGTRLARLLKETRASVMQATPATWRLLLESGWQGEASLKILCGGEAFPKDLAGLLLNRCKELWNLYGPTETTIWSTVYQIESKDDPILIGRPIDNTQIYILDKSLQPVPVGVAGELHIGGDGLARGYLNRPELTEEKFIQHPSVDDAKSQIYKTGDLARYRPDGRIECLGRIDHQIKLRGFRIELGEIEVALSKHPEVRESVVIVRRDESGDNRLITYIVAEKDIEPSVSNLRSFLRGELPEYMVPSIFMFLTDLPLTPNGKVDRNALPVPDQTRPELATDYVAPRNELEKTIADVWRKILNIEKVGVHDNFFDLGGHSLLLARVNDSLHDHLEREIPMVKMFQYPTIASLAKNLENGQDDSPLFEAVHDRVKRQKEALSRRKKLKQIRGRSL